MPQPARIFVSHSHEDSAWCQDFVGALRQAGADVWYDEHNLGYGRLMDEIERELRARRIFLAVFSPAAVTSPWVRREVNAAIHLHDAESDRKRHTRRSWDEESVFAAFAKCCSPSGFQAARRLYDFARSRGATFSWGAGPLPSVSARFFIGPKAYSVFSLYEWPAGKAVFALNFEYLLWGPLPLNALSRLADQVRTIPKVADSYAGLNQADFKKRPALSIDQILTQSGAMDTIEAAIDELLQTSAG